MHMKPYIMIAHRQPYMHIITALIFAACATVILTDVHTRYSETCVISQWTDYTACIYTYTHSNIGVSIMQVQL